jgi:hypothetical protein
MPYVNHYSFHILDPEWDHLTMKISGHPPFPAQVMLNGHGTWLARRAKPALVLPRKGIVLLIALTPQAWQRPQTPCPGTWKQSKRFWATSAARNTASGKRSQSNGK